MASGHVNRIKRPDTWLHRPMLQNVKKILANPEPSTHDPERTSVRSSSLQYCEGSPRHESANVKAAADRLRIGVYVSHRAVASRTPGSNCALAPALSQF